MADFDKLWDYNDPAGTEIKFRELLPKAKMTGDTNYLMELMTQIARAKGLQKKFDEAHEILDEVKSNFFRLQPLTKARYLLERGRAYRSAGSEDEASTYFLQAFEIANNKSLDYYAIDAAHMMGAIGTPEEQKHWNLRAIELTEKTQDENCRKWLGSLYNNIAWSYHDAGEFDEAMEYFNKALDWHMKHGNDSTKNIAKWSVARCKRSLKKTQEALNEQLNLEKDMAAAGMKPDGFVSEEIAECLYELGKHDEAKPYFAKAHQQLSEDMWLKDKEPQRLERLALLSK